MNLTFIGMSGAGKSFVGKYFAEQNKLTFIDIDTEMEVVYKKPLQQILNEMGDHSFLVAQSKQVQELGKIKNTVVSPGGSVVYTPEAMEYLASCSTIVYLEVPFSVIESRVADSQRGIVGLGGSSLEELYTQRSELYRQWANITIDTEGKEVSQICAEIVSLL